MSDTAYDDRQRATLTAVLDALVPPSEDGVLPGAGEVGLAAEIEAEAPELQPVVAPALATLDALATKRGAEGFAALDAASRAEVLNEHAESDPGFLGGLVFQAYTRYYRQPAVLTGLGMEPRPPHPLGYTIAPSDLDTLLARVRETPRRYREV